jgi:hypothetical protein
MVKTPIFSCGITSLLHLNFKEEATSVFDRPPYSSVLTFEVPLKLMKQITVRRMYLYAIKTSLYSVCSTILKSVIVVLISSIVIALSNGIFKPSGVNDFSFDLLQKLIKVILHCGSRMRHTTYMP